MKRTVVVGLGLSLLGSLHLAGCATDGGGGGGECLPGDIECADDSAQGGGGKADAFDYMNDPARMSQHLTYTLKDLPKKGDLKTPTWKDQYPAAVGHSAVAWADTYWPTSEGSHNARWQGAAEKSPLEKYDAAFNSAAGCATQPASMFGAGAKAAWDTYNTCAGPAAKWQTKEFQGGGQMHDGLDNDHDGTIDEEGADGIDGVQSWWGTCHAWTPAALTVPEPQQAVTVNGVTFAVGDIKALIQNAHDSTAAVMLGGRCNSKEIMHDVAGSANDACRDGNPGALHVVITNFLGISQLPLVEDRTANYEVWNQPVVGYEVTKQVKVTPSAAMTCVGATGTKYTYNTTAKDLYEVQMTVKYITESSASSTPVGFANNTRTDQYHYILEVSDAGKVVGGRFCTDSEDSHIDFLWSPTGRYNPSNPYVNVSKVNELVAKSVAAPGGTTTGTSKDFTATPNAAIPDNSATGVTVDVPVTGLTTQKTLAVTVQITHPYVGDLKLELLHAGRSVKILRANTGGAAHDLDQTYTLTAAEVGTAPNGTWSLKVVDSGAADIGSVKSVKLSFN